MTLLQDNPFYILNISMSADKKEIADSAEKQSLIADSEACNNAFSVLVSPQKRLSAEMDWFPELEDGSAERMCTAIRAHAPADLSGLSGLSLLNAARYNFDLLEPGKASRHMLKKVCQYASEIQMIAELFDRVDPEDVCRAINEKREKAGISQVEYAQIAEELQSLRQRTATGIFDKIRRMPYNEFRAVINMLADETASSDRLLDRIIIDDLFNKYEINISMESGALLNEIQKLADIIRESRVFPETLIWARIRRYLNKMRKWISLNRALIIRSAKYNTAYKQAEDAADMTRDLMFDLLNKEKFLDRNKAFMTIAREMAAMLQDSPVLAEPFEKIIEPTPEQLEGERKARAAIGKFWLFILACGLFTSLLMGTAFLHDGMYKEFFSAWFFTILPPAIAVFLLIRHFVRKNRQGKRE